MASSPASEILGHLRRTALLPAGAGVTDAELLELFVAARDEAAFAALVRRHGPMVWGVCRRVLAGHQDAEDAFQATFLVLVRKAASVVPRAMLANWLYGVAYQTARNAGAGLARRRRRERQVSPMPEPAAPQAGLSSDLLGVLDQELSRLPDKYRIAIVLCDLEGKTRKEAADQLGVPEGTLSGRLSRGRAMLARRLTRRGLAVTGGTLAIALSQHALSASVPAAAVSATIRAAGLLAAGHAAAGAVSARAAALAGVVVRAMLLTKLKVATAVLLLVCAAGVGAAGLAYQVHSAGSVPRSARAARRPADTAPEVRQRQPAGDATQPDRDRPKVTRSKETTYITSPLDPDGEVDYETALNERLGKGVTPRTNANVLLWQALGPHPNGMPMPPAFFRWMGMPTPPEAGDYFVGLEEYVRDRLGLPAGAAAMGFWAEHDEAMRQPWTAKDHPRLAAWLKANEKPLALVAEAVERPDYFWPLVAPRTPKGFGGLASAPTLGTRNCRDLVSALVARAMLHAGEGRLDKAWQDLQSCHCLSRLMARGATLVEFLIGLALDLRASNAELALVSHVDLTPRQARARLRDLQRLPPIPWMADKVDLGERFMFLDAAMRLRHRGFKELQELVFKELEPLGAGPRPKGPGANDRPRLPADLDWDHMLRSGNVWYDRLAAALRIQDRVAREQQLDRIEKEVKALMESARRAGVLGGPAAGRADARTAGRATGEALVVLFLPTTRKVQQACDRNEQVQRNLRLALALAAYRADHQRYPEKLDALAPAYLAQIPDDIFSGKPLVYRGRPDGYLLYSVGVNGRDEDGHGPGDTPPGDDLRVRMPASAARRP
jgi:RNA polymerase sigma factor (sigma-70 family)